MAYFANRYSVSSYELEVVVISRYKSLWDGRTYMTTQNAQRHFIKELSKAIKNDDYEKMQLIRSQMADNDLDTVCRCEYCSHEDLGYCGLRGQYGKDITDEEKAIKYCYPSILKGLEYDLGHKKK